MSKSDARKGGPSPPVRTTSPAVALCLAASLAACTKTQPAGVAPADGPPPSPSGPSSRAPPPCPSADACGWHAARCALSGPNGVSDIGRDADGRFWLLPEREPGGAASPDREIVPIDIPIDGTPPRLDEAAAIHFRLPDGPLDTESLAPIPGAFLVGTERGDLGLGYEAIYRVERASASGKLWAKIDLGTWSLQSVTNKGIEALCRAGDRVIAVLEQWAEHGEHDGETSSPLAVFDERAPEKGPLFTGRLLHLRRDTRISAMTCAPSDGGVTLSLLEVEGGSRRPSIHLLRTLSMTGAGATRNESTIDIDAILRRVGQDEVPNFEGIAYWNGGFVLVSDNENDGRRRGPTWLLELSPIARGAPGSGDDGGCL